MSAPHFPYTVWSPPTAPAAREPLAASAPLAPNVLWQMPAVVGPAHPEARADEFGDLVNAAPVAPEISRKAVTVAAEAVSRADGALAQTGTAIRRYRAVTADPPWQYENWSKAGEWKNASRHYGCMSIEQLARIPVRDVLTEDAVLFLWVTGPFIPRATEIATGWGFPEYSGLVFTWIKQSPSGKSWHFGPGYWSRHNAEVCLLFSRDQKPERKARDVPELLIAPRTRHSEKPEEMQNRVERLVDGPYLELFARRSRPGWTCLGNEITGNDIADDLRAIASQPSLDFADAAPADPQQQPDRTLEDRHE